ncbi:MAG: GWxTD domain-containing protein [Bacteroidetes bacterium]|nr:GWxTD domain-containing protein [Bacteroidota bacterium]
MNLCSLLLDAGVLYAPDVRSAIKIKGCRSAMRNSIRSTFLSALFLLSSAMVQAQIAEVVGPTSQTQAVKKVLAVQVDVDHAAFAYEESSSLVEIYLAFEAATLIYTHSENGFVAVLPVHLEVIRSTQASLSSNQVDAVWQDTLNLSFAIPDTTGLSEGQHFVHQLRAAIPPGEYELRIVVPEDSNVGRSGVSIKRDMVVPDFSQSNLVYVSDVTLASSIEQSSDRGDLFYKNGMVIRPNANQLFGSGLNTLFYYAEVYNLTEAVSGDGKYTVFSYIADANLPQPMANYQKRTQRTLRSPDVVVGTFNVKDLPSGSYFLRLAVLNENNESVAEQSRKFFVYNPDVSRQTEVVSAEESFERSQYARMTEEEIDRMTEHTDIIASDSERRRIKGIRDLDERRRYFLTFWNVRDPDPNTPINEYQEQFYSLIQYANDRYTNRSDEGWRTDRGRTLVKFGSPTSITPHMFDTGYNPYEVWEFNNIPGEGQAQFIFADLQGFGIFELIHSTVSGERKLSNWQQELRK